MANGIVQAVTPKAIIREQRCEKCKWIEPEGVPGKFRCHRNPPAVNLLGTQQGVKVISEWPVVLPHQHCGEWKARIEVTS